MSLIHWLPNGSRTGGRATATTALAIFGRAVVIAGGQILFATSFKVSLVPSLALQAERWCA